MTERGRADGARRTDDGARPADDGPRPAGGRSVLDGRALVTGGTSGIGLAFAHALAARGCPLVIVARDAARLEKTADQLRWRYGVDVETIRADLSETTDVATVVERLVDPTSPVEILVNNAGRGLHSPLLGEDLSEHDDALDLMVRAVLHLGGAAGRVMSERGHGVIVNVGSVQAFIAMGAYSALKAWVYSYSEALALELEGSGVQVTTLLPGWVRTEFHDRAGVSRSKIPEVLWLDPERVVAECLADVERGRPRSTPSRRYKVLAFLAQYAPRPAVRFVAARIVRLRRR